MLAIFTALILTSCFSPDFVSSEKIIRIGNYYRCPDRQITVSFDSSFNSHHLALAKDAFLYLKYFGVTSRLVFNNGNIRVVNFQDTSCSTEFLGFYISETDYIIINPTCIFDDFQFERVVIHEIGHWFGMEHICDYNGLTTDLCSPIGYGKAILNPFLEMDDNNLIPTNLDLQEYSRTCWSGFRERI